MTDVSEPDVVRCRNCSRRLKKKKEREVKQCQTCAALTAAYAKAAR